MQLVPAASGRDKSHRVNWPFLLQNPTNSTSLNFWDKCLQLAPLNASCELLVEQVPVTSSGD